MHAAVLSFVPGQLLVVRRKHVVYLYPEPVEYRLQGFFAFSLLPNDLVLVAAVTDKGHARAITSKGQAYILRQDNRHFAMLSLRNGGTV